MRTNILTAATLLSDQDLLTRLDALAGNERVATVELVAHLAALGSRPSVYAAQGFGSLFAYCVEALHLSEDAACARIEVARACRSFPPIFDLLVSGEMTLTSVRLLARLLTPENHRTVLDRARGKSRREIEALIAELAPRPDSPTSVRKLPTPVVAGGSATTPVVAGGSATTPAPLATPTRSAGPEATTRVLADPALPRMPAPAVLAPARRPIVQATAPERYRVQFTIGEETHEKLRRVQALLRREIPSGDPAVLFDRALTLLLEKVEKTRLGAAPRPRAEGAIRAETDRRIGAALRRSRHSSRHIPRAVARAVWQRDGGRCAFSSSSGHRCSERSFLEFHHIDSYAKGGPATVENISLRCRRHNDYEAELIFGPRADKSEGFVMEGSRSIDAGLDVSSP